MTPDAPRIACQLAHDSSCELFRLPAGRATQGLGAAAGRAPTDAAAWFAMAERLERIAIRAFSRLALELADHGAPRALRCRADAARRDEQRHAAIMRKLGASFGGKATRVRYKDLRRRPLLEVLVENAVEGCVNETLGAAIALHQADRAASPAVRSALRDVARDEVRHASLAWSIHEWGMTRLSARNRNSVARAMSAAVRSAIGTRAELPAPLSSLLGYPTASTVRAMARALDSELWNCSKAMKVRALP